ncbi:MAG TPA: hypothetical protein VK808_08700, partial [Bacteroidia bacterium]|nr:hypothetical protein [Bacteroidia bacterium]
MKHIICLPPKFICFLFLIFCFSFLSFSQTFYITTFAGNSSGGFSGDGGQATSAEINFPQNIFLTGAPGDVYIADAWNNRIRMVNPG